MASTQRKTVEVGGVRATSAQIREAVQILTASAGIMVKQPLAKAGNPLAECEYHSLANEQRQIEGTASQTKPASIRALERLAAEAYV